MAETRPSGALLAALQIELSAAQHSTELAEQEHQHGGPVRDDHWESVRESVREIHRLMVTLDTRREQGTWR